MNQINKNDIKIMQLLNDMQSIQTKISILNEQENLVHWIESIETALNGTVYMQNKSILRNIEKHDDLNNKFLDNK